MPSSVAASKMLVPVGQLIGFPSIVRLISFKVPVSNEGAKVYDIRSVYLTKGIAVRG